MFKKITYVDCNEIVRDKEREKLPIGRGAFDPEETLNGIKFNSKRYNASCGEVSLK